MNKLGLILGVTMIVLLSFWVWAVMGSESQISNDQLQEKALKTQSSDQGDVIVGVTPVELKPGKEARFKVILDTHSVELSYDLLQVANLIDDQGTSLKAVSWNGGLGGHHLNGELIFPPISDKAKMIELKLKNISNFDRSFKWSLT